MLYNEREQQIMLQLKLQPTVKVTELARLLDVSNDTIRRDLRAMEKSGLVRCLRGGACLPESLKTLSDFKGREVINESLKKEIAKKALAYIQPGAVIAMNSGTTNTVLAYEMLTLTFPFTVVTNNMAAAWALMQNEHIQLMFAGGTIDPMERSTYGSECEECISGYFPDVAFLSINALNSKDAFTDFRFREIPVMQRMAESAKQVIALMDSSKLGRCSKQKALRPEQVDFTLMDDHVSADILSEYANAGMEIR